MRIGSLFSGYGGLDIAVQAVYGGDLAWYSEIDKHACTVLAAHHPGVPNLGDITAVDWADVEPVDILTGGYPCQPFSHAGQRKGTNDERHLWPYVRDAIVALRPMVAVFENVDGHRSLGLDVVLGDLAAVGLSARWGVVRAADAGAPHGRKRVFIVVAQPDQPRPQGADAGLDVGTGRRGAGGHAAAGVDGTAADPDGDGHPEARRAAATQADRTSGADRGRDRIPAAVRASEPTTADAVSERHHGSGAERPAGEPQRGRADAPRPAALAADAQGGRRGARTRPAARAGGHQEPGTGDSGGAAAADPNGAGRGIVKRQQPSVGSRRDADGRGSSDGGGTAADADRHGHGGGPDSRGMGSLEAGDEGEPRERQRARGESGAGSAVAWGKYEPAIRRWEHVLGRPAPDPTIPGANGRPRLSPAFVEWMMGLPEGHVTGHGLRPAQCLKMLGNGVVPQQASLALRMLLDDEVAA